MPRRASSRIAVVPGAILVTALLSGCASSAEEWAPTTGPLGAVISTEVPDSVRITLQDGSRSIVREPRIEGDSLIGNWALTGQVCGPGPTGGPLTCTQETIATTRLALGDVLDVEVGRPRPEPPSGRFVGGGVGVGRGTMFVGGSSKSRTGLLLTGEVGSTRSGYRRWFLDASGHFFGTPSPALREKYHGLTVAVHRSFGSKVFVAPALGVELRTWSGPERVEEMDFGLSFGASLGGAFRVGEALLLIPQATWRTSHIELEGSVYDELIAIQVLVIRQR